MYARIQFELLSANPLSQSQFRTQPPVQACLDLPLSFNRCRLFLLTPFPTSLTNPRHITPFPATLTKIHPGWHHSRLPRASRGHSPLITRHFLLTPLFPLLTRHISATPLFPTDTENMGVGSPTNQPHRYQNGTLLRESVRSTPRSPSRQLRKIARSSRDDFLVWHCVLGFKAS
jgi:hypothetical protein